MLKISIVIPVYNEESLLRRCLTSLKNQDYIGEYEIIVVDNGSTDDTAKIAAEFTTKVISCSQKGVVYARQAGAYSAAGDIVVQADADTVYPGDWLSRIGSYFQKHGRTVALAGTFNYINPPWWANIEYFLRTAANFSSLFFFRKPVIISGANFAFRRESFLKLSGYDPNSRYPDQLSLSDRLNSVGPVAFDAGSIALTSSRRVQKPLFRILADLLRNCAGGMAYFARTGSGLKALMIKSHLFRSPSRF